MIIKKDKNEELEKILAQKEMEEQAKNLLQGILYKIEVSYKDYKKVKAKNQTEEKFVRELLENIDKKCGQIKIVKPSKKVADEEIQKELEKRKFYVGEEIVSYPIEEKILYAIEEKSRYSKILNNKYGDATIAISNLINTGKNMDRVEVLRDFNGWSWTTLKREVENIEANLIYQTIQIILGEEFLENWCQDKDGIIDYLDQFVQKTSSQFGDLLTKIALVNTVKENKQFAQEVEEKIKKIDEQINENIQEKIIKITNHKKQLLQELNEIEKVIGQNTRLKAEYEKRNEEAPIDQKVFNIKIFKKQLENKKQNLLEQIGKYNYLLNPLNYLEEQKKLLEKKLELQITQISQEEIEELLIQFVKEFLKYFKMIIRKTKDEDEILKLIYQFRYFMLLPFNFEKSIKDIEQLEKSLLSTQKLLVEKAKAKKVIADVPFEIMSHVFKTRIIILEDLCYKITRNKDEKYFVQILDENISEDKFEIILEEKTKVNKKIRIFI